MLQLALATLLSASPLPWAAFVQDHAGQSSADIGAEVSLTPEHGVVVHDGVCAYSERAKLGCFDPRASDLACGAPVVLARGVVWLYLHRAVYAPFDGSAKLEHAFPLWLFSAARLGDGVAIWGMGDDDTQELWTWDPERDAAAKAFAGPAAMSGGIDVYPGAPRCLALAYYVPTAEVCQGRTEVVRWCDGDAESSAPLVSWQGCSGRIVASREGVLSVHGASAATLYPWDRGPERDVVASRTTLGLFQGRDGHAAAALFDGERVSVAPVR